MIGSLAGWLAYDGGLPGEWTTGGGIILIFSVFLVSYGTHTAQNIEMGDEDDSKADIEAVDTSKDRTYSSVAQELVLVKMVKNGVNFYRCETNVQLYYTILQCLPLESYYPYRRL